MNYLAIFLRVLIILTLFASLVGCTTKFHFNTPEMTPQYPQMAVPFPHSVVLIVPQKTQDMAFTVPMRRWCIGEAVSSHIASALKSSFKNVVVSEDGKIPADTDRILYCSLGDKTDMKFGILVTSDKTATIELNCKMLDAARTTLWEGGILHSETFNAGIIGQMLPLTAVISVFYKKADVSGAEEAYAAMITAGTNNSMILTVDHFMEKMIKEGRTKICPNCKDDSDWRKSVEFTDDSESDDSEDDSAP